MADSVIVKVDGLRELGYRMQRLSQDMALKIARSATGAAAQVIKKKAISNVIASPSVDEGDLKANIIVKRIPDKRSNLTSEHIVTVRGKGRARKDGKRGAPHARFIEFGTVNMPAEPFLRPAFDTEKSKAVDAMVKRLKARLTKVGV